jgi:hypothetical protein
MERCAPGTSRGFHELLKRSPTIHKSVEWASNDQEGRDRNKKFTGEGGEVVTLLSVFRWFVTDVRCRSWNYCGRYTKHIIVCGMTMTCLSVCLCVVDYLYRPIIIIIIINACCGFSSLTLLVNCVCPSVPFFELSHHHYGH